MNASLIFRQLTRTGLKPNSNGIAKYAAINSRVARAFAIVPLRAASTLSHNKTLAQTVPNVGGANKLSVRQSSSEGDYVKHWTAERALSVVLLGAIPAAIAVPSPAVEAFLALSLTVHSHWGIEALVHDYIRPSVFGATIPVVCTAMVYGLSVMTLGSLLYFIYSDVGIINAVSMLWKL